MANTTKKMTEDPVVLRILDLLHEQNRKDKELTDFLGLPPGSMARWKYDGLLVYLKYIVQICDFLQTTPNYLFYGKSSKDDYFEGLSPLENDIIRMLRLVDDDRKHCIRETLRLFVESKQL